MIVLAEAATGGPTEWLTAIGTLAAVVVALFVALWGDWRTRTQYEKREQLSEAAAVQIVLTRGHGTGDPVGSSRLNVAVVNRGRFAITGVEAQFCLQVDNNPRLFPPESTMRWPGFAGLDERLQRGLETIEDPDAYAGRLAPWDKAMWFAIGHIADRSTDGWYPVVRWSDRWGIRWEYRLGELRRIQESADWTP